MICSAREKRCLRFVGFLEINKVAFCPCRKFYGKVDSIISGTGSSFSLFPPENATGNFVKVVQRIPVKIVFDNPAEAEKMLKVGMSVETTVIVEK